jgi:hypothetical protein
MPCHATHAIQMCIQKNAAEIQPHLACRCFPPAGAVTQHALLANAAGWLNSPTGRCRKQTNFGHPVGVGRFGGPSGSAGVMPNPRLTPTPGRRHAQKLGRNFDRFLFFVKNYLLQFFHRPNLGRPVGVGRFSWRSPSAGVVPNPRGVEIGAHCSDPRRPSRKHTTTPCCTFQQTNCVAVAKYVSSTFSLHN